MTKRVVAAVLCAIMALALLPAAALADDDYTGGLHDAIEDAIINYNGNLTLSKTYQGSGGAASVTITESLTLDLAGNSINDITLHIGSATDTPVVTIKNSGTTGSVNYSGTDNAVNVINGYLIVENGKISGDRDPSNNSNGIEITDGSITIRGGEITGYTGIDYQGGSLTFDCDVGKTASITGTVASLAVASGKFVTVNADTRVKVGITETSATDLIGNITGDITLDIRPAPSSITPPSDLRAVMRDEATYSEPFTLAGDPTPNINWVEYAFNGGSRTHGEKISWETNRVKVLTGKLNPGVYTVTVTDTSINVSCDWQVTIVPFDVPVTADKPRVAENRYVIDPGEWITFTADTGNVIQGGSIMWTVTNLAYEELAMRAGKLLTYAPTEAVVCTPLVLLHDADPSLSSIKLDSIKVYLRVKITQGANSRWLRDNAEGLRFVTTGKEVDFSGIYVDDVANEISRSMSAGKYNFSPDPTGGMVLTLLPEFLATLSDGPHTLTFQYEDRENTVSTVIYIGNDTGGGDLYGDVGADVPKTGDGTPLALLSGAGLAVSVTVRRKKRAE